MIKRKGGGGLCANVHLDCAFLTHCAPASLLIRQPTFAQVFVVSIRSIILRSFLSAMF